MYNKGVKIYSRPTGGEMGIVPKEVACYVETLLVGMSARYAVAKTLSKRPPAPARARATINRKDAKKRFKALAQAEKLGRQCDRLEVRVARLEEAERHNDLRYGPLLQKQGETILQFMDCLEVASKTYVLCPGGQYVHVDYTERLKELKKYLKSIEQRWEYYVQVRGGRQRAAL